jgi:ribose transport system substrate-binding protein
MTHVKRGDDAPGTTRRDRWRLARITMLAGSLVCASALATGTAAANNTTSTTATAQACGQDANFKADDPTNALGALSAKVRKEYQTWPYSVAKSPWTAFKGIKPPWKIGFISEPNATPYQLQELATLKSQFAAAKKLGLVTGSLVTYIQPSYSTATPEQQISAIQQMVRQGVNGIMLVPLQTTPLGPAIDAAGKKGVVVALAGNVIPNSKYVINVWANNNSPAYAGAAGVVKKGNVLVVRGQAGNTVEGAFEQAAQADVKACPGLKIVGEVQGNWVSSTAQTAVLKYLTSHPTQKIDLVLQHGGMMPGIIAAFEKAGVKVPPISDGNASGSDLSWWLKHKADYQTVGTTFTGAMTSYSMLRIIFRVLGGQGPKLRDISFTPALITNDNLATYAIPGLPLDSQVQPKGPVDGWCSNSCLDGYFVKPGTPKGF